MATKNSKIIKKNQSSLRRMATRSLEGPLMTRSSSKKPGRKMTFISIASRKPKKATKYTPKVYQDEDTRNEAKENIEDIVDVQLDEYVPNNAGVLNNHLLVAKIFADLSASDIGRLSRVSKSIRKHALKRLEELARAGVFVALDTVRDGPRVDHSFDPYIDSSLEWFEFEYDKKVSPGQALPQIITMYAPHLKNLTLFGFALRVKSFERLPLRSLEELSLVNTFSFNTHRIDYNLKLCTTLRRFTYVNFARSWATWADVYTQATSLRTLEAFTMARPTMIMLDEGRFHARLQEVTLRIDNGSSYEYLLQSLEAPEGEYLRRSIRKLDLESVQDSDGKLFNLIFTQLPALEELKLNANVNLHEDEPLPVRNSASTPKLRKLELSQFWGGGDLLNSAALIWIVGNGLPELTSLKLTGDVDESDGVSEACLATFLARCPALAKLDLACLCNLTVATLIQNVRLDRLESIEIHMKHWSQEDYQKLFGNVPDYVDSKQRGVWNLI